MQFTLANKRSYYAVCRFDKHLHIGLFLGALLLGIHAKINPKYLCEEAHMGQPRLTGLALSVRGWLAPTCLAKTEKGYLGFFSHLRSQQIPHEAEKSVNPENHEK